MPVITIRPMGAGVLTEWSPSPGPNNWANVDEANPHDADTTYNFFTYSGADTTKSDLYQIQDPSIPTGNLIDGLMHRMVVRVTASGLAATVRARLYDGSEILGSENTPGTAYATFSYGWPTNPTTGNRWTAQQISDLHAGMKGRTPSGPAEEMRITQLYLEVTYSFHRLVSESVDVSDGIFAFLKLYEFRLNESVDVSDATLRNRFRPPPSTVVLAISSSLGPSEPLTAVWLQPIDTQFGKDARANLVKIPGRSGGVFQWGGAEPRAHMFPAMFTGDYASMTTKRTALDNLVWHTQSDLRGRPATLSFILNGEVIDRIPVVVDSYDVRSRRGRRSLWDVTLNLRHYEA